MSNEKLASTKKQLRIVGWIAVSLGVFFTLWGLDLLYSIPKESELLEVAGKPTEVQEKVHQGKNGTTRTTTFRLDGHSVVYSDHSPHYDEIVESLNSSKPVTAWLSPRKESLILPTDCVPIYKFECNGQRFLAYSEKVEDEHQLLPIVFFLGFFMPLIGVWSFSQIRWQEKLAALRDA